MQKTLLFVFILLFYYIVFTACHCPVIPRGKYRITTGWQKGREQKLGVVRVERAHNKELCIGACWRREVCYGAAWEEKTKRCEIATAYYLGGFSFKIHRPTWLLFIPIWPVFIQVAYDKMCDRSIKFVTDNGCGESCIVQCPPIQKCIAKNDPKVWGTDDYPKSSALCTSALHAKAMGQEGGTFRVVKGNKQKDGKKVGEQDSGVLVGMERVEFRFQPTDLSHYHEAIIFYGKI